MEEQKILNLVYDFYPRGIETCSLEYPDRPEVEKLKNILKNPINTQKANNLYDEFVILYGKTNVHNMTLFGWGNPCYHFRVICRDGENVNKFIVFISVISDYYYIYKHDDLWQEKEKLEGNNYDKILKNVKTFFPEYKALPPNLARQIVPDIMLDSKDFGDVSILNCLFTDHIY